MFEEDQLFGGQDQGIFDAPALKTDYIQQLSAAPSIFDSPSIAATPVGPIRPSGGSGTVGGATVIGADGGAGNRAIQSQIDALNEELTQIDPNDPESQVRINSINNNIFNLNQRMNQLLGTYTPNVERWRKQAWDQMPPQLRARPDAAVLLDKALYVIDGESGGRPDAVGDGGAAWFCSLTEGENGFSKWPAGARADCSGLAQGVIAYEWAAS